MAIIKFHETQDIVYSCNINKFGVVSDVIMVKPDTPYKVQIDNYGEYSDLIITIGESFDIMAYAVPNESYMIC